MCNCTAQHLHLSNEFGKRSLCLRAGFICDAAEFSPRVKFARYAALVRTWSLVKISVAIAWPPASLFRAFRVARKSFSHRSALKSRNLFQVVIDLSACALRICRLQTAYHVVHNAGRWNWMDKKSGYRYFCSGTLMVRPWILCDNGHRKQEFITKLRIRSLAPLSPSLSLLNQKDYTPLIL